ncbi:SdpI/YhfL protein family protein [uncultured archaeon]|nr:SdpI/YhfL protein family protein [uncultured archaeon]
MRKLNIASFIVILLSFLIGILSYGYFPDKMATHWDALGQCNGYMPKFWGTFSIPLISLGLFLLFLLIPIIDPLKKNIEKFRKYYDTFILITLLFLFYVYILTIFWNFGIVFNMNVAFIPALGFLFFYMGVILQKIKRNWFIGIRTPWTLSSETVWDKTHKLGSILFKVSGVITLIGIFFPRYVLWFVLGPVVISGIWLIIYSYLMHRKEEKD